MNHIYKVIWSRVKNSYVVVSEIAGTARKSGRVRVSKNTLAAVLAAFLLTGISVSPVSAALDGVNTFVEPGNQNIKIGNDIDLRNNSTKNGAIAIGDHAQIDDYVMQEGSIAIGKNAFVENMWGTQDKIFRFGMHSTDPSRTDHLLPAGIAIGQNTYARSGSLMIGDHKYVGALGDTTVNSNTDNEKRKLSVLVGATTVGLNSYSAGAFATTTGAYSIMTNAYDGNTNQGFAAQNFGAVINGSFNSIESKTSGSSVSGIANAVVGTANRTHNANGTLVFGAGNEVTNSVDNIADPMSLLTNSPKELAEKLREGIRRNDSGGAVLAVGGGNKADYAYRSQLIGVGNTLEGTAAQKAAYNLLNGYRNTVTKAEHVSVIGSENTIENSKSQTVIGDSNKITDRNAGTVSGKQEERTKNVSDLVIGKGNKIKGNSTYMKGYESLTVIGNNNEMVNPGAGIVIGDNQKVGAIRESVVIGSMTPEEKADSDIQQKHASVVVGYHAQSGTRDGGGMNVALGHGAKAYGWQETVTGIKSIVEAGSGHDGYLASVYGGLNTVASNKADQNDGMANTVVGTLNKTEGANGALVFGAGNSVTHSFGTAPTDEDGNSMNEHWSDAILGGGQKYAIGEGPLGHDEIRKAMGLAMSTGGGSVVTMGNGNTSDYAVHSQIIGSGNILTGTANTPSINNTINGYGNTGRNVERMSMMGTGNNISDGTADVVIGDYHHMDGGKNNVILGSMATEKKTVEKTYTMKDVSGNVILEKKYKVTENVPIKSHTANISNAVMLGYNTDVEKDGGVALGADSIASVDKGAAGYDPAAGDHANDTTGTWKATAAAVSVGKAADPTSAAVTRQITNVAAGTQDTDAVNVAQLKAVNTKYDTKLSRGFIIKKGGETVGETISLNGDTAPEITFDVAEANKGLTVDRDGKTIKYGIDGSKIDLNGNDTIPGWTLEVGVKPGIPTNTGSAEGNKKVIKPNDTVTLRADNGIRLKQENGVVDIGLKYMAVDTKWTNINDAAATNGGMAIGANSNADGETSVALGWGSNISASNYAAALSPFSSAVNSEYGLAMGTKAAVKTSPYGMAMGALSSVDDSEYGAAIGANSAIAKSNYGVAIGTSATVKDADNAVAIGVSSSAAVKDGVAIGAFSKADTAAGVSGYDPSTKAASTDTSAAWRSTVSAASVGTRRKAIPARLQVWQPAVKIPMPSMWHS
ncbi:ESPR-type extended signal peptide-containing protein [Dialister invisus]|uniref:ESPR-type extended signal peptide-containing protein n=1 Tax=Dialister invisus TaxID=218538 RepID=UPI003FEFBBE3